jgi:uncharacterized protein (DUF983 family)
MSQSCKDCNAGISFTDYNAEDEVCSSCQLDDMKYQLSDAEAIVSEILSGNTMAADALARQYRERYLNQ